MHFAAEQSAVAESVLVQPGELHVLQGLVHLLLDDQECCPDVAQEQDHEDQA